MVKSRRTLISSNFGQNVFPLVIFGGQFSEPILRFRITDVATGVVCAAKV
jgi:hypothetical protein